MSAIFNSILAEEFTIQTYLICIAAAFACGIISAFAASYKTHVSKSFMVSLILLPAIVATVIYMVNGNVGTGVAVMGAFSLVRFRSVAGKAKDIASLFMAMTAGLACASGYVAIAVLFTLIVCAVMMILGGIPMGEDKNMLLTITVPESLHFNEEFNEVFDRYTKSHQMIETKTSNMGSLYKLKYKVQMNDASQMKEFIDDLRIRNGNLEISMAGAGSSGDEL